MGARNTFAANQNVISRSGQSQPTIGKEKLGKSNSPPRICVPRQYRLKYTKQKRKATRVAGRQGGTGGASCSCAVAALVIGSPEHSFPGPIELIQGAQE